MLRSSRSYRNRSTIRIGRLGETRHHRSLRRKRPKRRQCVGAMRIAQERLRTDRQMKTDLSYKNKFACRNSTHRLHIAPTSRLHETIHFCSIFVAVRPLLHHAPLDRPAMNPFGAAPIRQPSRDSCRATETHCGLLHARPGGWEGCDPGRRDLLDATDSRYNKTTFAVLLACWSSRAVTPHRHESPPASGRTVIRTAPKRDLSPW